MRPALTLLCALALALNAAACSSLTRPNDIAVRPAPLPTGYVPHGYNHVPGQVSCGD